MTASEKVIVLALAKMRDNATKALKMTEGEQVSAMDLCTVRVELRALVASLDKMKAWIEGSPCSG
jgi:hypothetical protein